MSVVPVPSRAEYDRLGREIDRAHADARAARLYRERPHANRPLWDAHLGRLRDRRAGLACLRRTVLIESAGE